MKKGLKIYEVDNGNGLAVIVVARDKKQARETAIAYCKAEDVEVEYPINTKSVCETVDTSIPHGIAFVGY